MKHKKQTHRQWEKSYASQEEYRDTSLECMVGSEKIRHGWTLSEDVKNEKKGFYRCIIQKKKTKEAILLSDKWDKGLEGASKFGC